MGHGCALRSLASTSGRQRRTSEANCLNAMCRFCVPCVAFLEVPIPVPHAVRRAGTTLVDAPAATVFPHPLRTGSTPALALLAGRPIVPDLAERLLTGSLHDPV